ncbi:hypothetical protein GT755_01025 [Herbidospora sp. NEAU-GS84]|uniref:Uncharacterized protein n=1 Tax=Herbidospora solisilvae TaxID=2696284 RepID=A0A7C9J9T0_9ACTN|nr:DUF5994 family protein [Herbidospora solisilvae]NAS20261.1 hypothetical protein [Herbidospora solisilvae]
MTTRRTPIKSVASAMPHTDGAQRLSLDPALNRTSVADGAWWPYTRDAAAELPGLIAAVDQRMGRATMRVGLHADAWDDIPRRIPARGRQVRVDWLRHSDPRMITITLDGCQQVTLLVAPPGPAPALDAGELTGDELRLLAAQSAV